MGKSVTKLQLVLRAGDPVDTVVLCSGFLTNPDVTYLED